MNNHKKAERLRRCPKCRNEFPQHLIQTLVSNFNRAERCPLCALIERNEMHGLPIGTPFHGTIANELFVEAFAYAIKKEWIPRSCISEYDGVQEALEKLEK